MTPFDLHQVLIDPVRISDQGSLSVLCGRSIPTPFYENQLAASVTSQLGNKSIDRTKKRYIDDNTYNLRESINPDRKQFIDYLTDSFRTITEVTDSVDMPSFTPTCLGHYLAGASLIRLNSAFYWATIVAAHGHRFECQPLVRQVVEQLAWVMTVTRSDDEATIGTNPQSCIRTLKSFFPGAGKFYGKLSEQSHIHTSMTSRYIAKSGPQHKIVLADPICGELAVDIAYATDMFCCVFEYVFHRSIHNLQSIELDPNSGKVHFSPERGNQIKLRETRDWNAGLDATKDRGCEKSE